MTAAVAVAAAAAAAALFHPSVRLAAFHRVFPPFTLVRILAVAAAAVTAAAAAAAAVRAAAAANLSSVLRDKRVES